MRKFHYTLGYKWIGIRLRHAWPCLDLVLCTGSDIRLELKPVDIELGQWKIFKTIGCLGTGHV